MVQKYPRKVKPPEYATMTTDSYLLIACIYHDKRRKCTYYLNKINVNRERDNATVQLTKRV